MVWYVRTFSVVPEFGIAELDCVVFLLFLSRTQVTVLTLGDTILMSLYIHRLELPRRWLAHGETF